MSHTYISWELNEWACLLRHNFVQILIKDTLGIIKWNTYKPPSQEEKSPDPISHFFPFCVLFLHLSLGGNIKQMLFLSPLCTQAAIWPVSLASMEWTATKPALAMSRTAIPCLVLAIYVRKISPVSSGACFDVDAKLVFFSIMRALKDGKNTVVSYSCCTNRKNWDPPNCLSNEPDATGLLPAY